MYNPVNTPNILRDTSRGVQAISIEDSLLADRKVFLTGEIDARTSDSLIKQLMYLDQDDAHEEITLYINSPGGEVISGMAIYDYIMLMRSPVRTVCTGLAASMGSIIFLAGEKREMLPHTELMIHDPSVSGTPSTKALELQQKARGLMKTREMLTGIIAERTGRPIKQVRVRARTRTDSYFSAGEALAFGLATGIVQKL